MPSLRRVRLLGERLRQAFGDARGHLDGSVRTDPVIHIDFATPTGDGHVKIQGWIASDLSIVEISTTADPSEHLRFVERPDVRAALPSYPHVKGFDGTVRSAPDGGSVGIVYRLAREIRDGVHVVAVSRRNPVAAVVDEPMSDAKRAKRARIASWLCCPLCRGDLTDGYSACSRCGRTYEHTATSFNFLTDSVRNEYAIIETENVSSNKYDATALELIAANSAGLVLDCGAGSRDVYYPNVVNYEIVPYPSTDVLGVGERLPFRDGTFDAALSLAVLEHVKDPFQCARELSRVLKPGGKLYCVVPFLQPVHGYPNHFYNMTAQGLRALFAPEIDVVASDVPESGVPIWTLSAILQIWSAALPERVRRRFLSTRVRYLTRDPVELLGEDFVRELPLEKKFELASTTLVIGVKR